jgi:threonine/homoserine/homoserine lactone efflux protein
MSEGLTVWSALFLLGAYHGINPGMGWLFAVARGMQEHRARAVAWSLGPIALGHALSIGVVVLIFQLAQVALPMLHIRVVVAVTLVALGVYKLIGGRHFRWGGMQAGFYELTIWSFLMALAQA